MRTDFSVQPRLVRPPVRLPFAATPATTPVPPAGPTPWVSLEPALIRKWHPVLQSLAADNGKSPVITKLPADMVPRVQRWMAALEPHQNDLRNPNSDIRKKIAVFEESADVLHYLMMSELGHRGDWIIIKNAISPQHYISDFHRFIKTDTHEHHREDATAWALAGWYRVRRALPIDPNTNVCEPWNPKAFKPWTYHFLRATRRELVELHNALPPAHKWKNLNQTIPGLWIDYKINPAPLYTLFNMANQTFTETGKAEVALLRQMISRTGKDILGPAYEDLWSYIPFHAFKRTARQMKPPSPIPGVESKYASKIIMKPYEALFIAAELYGIDTK